MRLETCMRHWFDNLRLGSHYPNIPTSAQTGVSDLVSTQQHTAHLSCSSGVIHHVCVWLDLVIITALWLWSWSLSIRARNYEACPPALHVSVSLLVTRHTRHLLPALVLWSHHHQARSGLRWPYIIGWTQCCHNSDCLSFKSPVTARRVPDTPPHPVCPHLISTHRKIIYNSNAWGIL